MKIIDDKGRLFGRINIIDFAIILFVITVIVPIVISAVNFSKYRAVTFSQTEKAKLEKKAYDEAYEKFLASLKEEERIKQEKKAAEDQKQALITDISEKAHKEGYAVGLKAGEELFCADYLAEIEKQKMALKDQRHLIWQEGYIEGLKNKKP